MILFDLDCKDGHRFEAWFRDGPNFDEQATAGAISCPWCGSTEVIKAPMAPHVAKPARREAERLQATPSERKARAVLEAMRDHVESVCDYVGTGFAEEARRIHYGEADGRGIYGEASREEARELRNEGIEFNRIPWLSRRQD